MNGPATEVTAVELPIVLWPNRSLNQVSRPVEDVKNPDFQRLVDNMLLTVQRRRGAGLSAIQVGEPLRVFVTNVGGQQAVYINPFVQELVGPRVALGEGCLSIPGYYEQVERHLEMVLVSLNAEGEEVVTQLEGLEAHVAQHELEHLDGKLMVDGIGPVKRDALKRKIAKELKRRAR